MPTFAHLVHCAFALSVLEQDVPEADLQKMQKSNVDVHRLHQHLLEKTKALVTVGGQSGEFQWFRHVSSTWLGSSFLARLWAGPSSILMCHGSFF